MFNKQTLLLLLLLLILLLSLLNTNWIFYLEIATGRSCKVWRCAKTGTLYVRYFNELMNPGVAEHNEDPKLSKIPKPMPSTSKGTRQYVCNVYIL